MNQNYVCPYISRKMETWRVLKYIFFWIINPYLSSPVFHPDFLCYRTAWHYWQGMEAHIVNFYGESYYRSHEEVDSGEDSDE